MAKKPKDPNNSTVDNKPVSAPATSSSDIFKTLFGNIPEQQDGSVSIFSDSNPFRRKPTTDDSVEIPKSIDTEIPDGDKENKRKRKKEKLPPNLDADDSTIKASDVKKSRNLNLGSVLDLNEDERKSPKFDDESKNMELDIKGLGKEKKKKKKRKRDEIEAEYEERKYGVKEYSEEGVFGRVNVGEKRKKLDTPEEMLVSKEGFDDEEKLLRTVFVGNLPLKVKKKALLKEFSQFGEIESVRLRSVPLLNEKTPRKGAIIKKQINDAVDRVNAYIVFKLEESAKASLSHNMAVIGGNHIHVDRACPPRKKMKGENAPLYDSKRTVFVGNLPFDVKDEEIYQLFTGINNLKSSIEAIRVIRDPGTSLGKGIAYVLFNTRDAANMVAKKHNLKIRDRELRLSHATPNSTPSKRKDSFPDEKYNSSSKKLAVGIATPGNGNKVKTISYQGMRASKSGVQKRGAPKISVPVRSESKIQKVGKPAFRTGKRPAVAARKAAANQQLGGGGGSGSTQAGKKRKPESRTPQSNKRNKKARKFR